jgi:hypothetical protein
MCERLRRCREDAPAALKLSKNERGSALQPIRIDERSTADRREQVGAILGGFLPDILLIACQQGIAAALLAWCRWWFQREEVLFRN